MGEVRALIVAPTLDDAARAFLHNYEKIGSDGTRRVYRIALNQMIERFGAQATLGVLDDPAAGERFRAWFREAFAGAKPRTRAGKLAALQSAFGWWRLQGWMVTDPTQGLTRPSIPRDRTRVHGTEEVEALWERQDVPLREKTLWRMLYETAARCEEILTLNVEDLDLPNKRARVRRKGGTIDRVFWQTGTARLLPRLLEGRQRGPVFLADRKPRGPVATADLCPVTGRARLSYRRAHEVLHAMTGWTLHDFRRAALSHDSDQGTPIPMLMARSGHSSFRSLEPYIRTSEAALARHVAASDPAARRR
ncbi:site-specific integrase [Streptosporangium sp. NPDC051023]|uniref:tyrosine-type recombinase/integrase n=1 Tax=Streptosporangium sp. NPDC051023 TaxID=3155410 RepID=UPI003450F0C6